jgi:hypothetical protein
MLVSFELFASIMRIIMGRKRKRGKYVLSCCGSVYNMAKIYLQCIEAMPC